MFRIYNLDRSDPDMTLEELEELALLMSHQPEPRVPDFSGEIKAFVEEVKRCVKEHFETLKQDQGSKTGDFVESGEGSSSVAPENQPKSILRAPKEEDGGKKTVRFEVGLDPIPER